MSSDVQADPPADPGQVTHLLRQIGEGNSSATSELMGLVYGELRALAGRLFSDSGRAVTLQPTALVHDAFLKLVERADDWNDRQHFFAVSSLAMRQMLKDAAKARRTLRRGGDWMRVSLSGMDGSAEAEEVDLIDLDAALDRLSSLSERQARIVELRYLTGLPVNEVADILGVSTTTVGDDWRAARAFLRRELERGRE